MRISDWSSDVCSSDLAYLALTLVGQPQAGETVLVSTAAGPVGSAVGQIAKICGCRTVGIAGGSEKAQRCIQAFGYDAAHDYQGEDVDDRVATLCTAGFDVDFDQTACWIKHVRDT